MSEEIKETTEVAEKTECTCEKCAKVKEFLFYAGAVFTGVFLAILLSALILKPKCPPPGAPGMMPPAPVGIQQRQLPPPPMMRDNFRPDGPMGNQPVEFRGRHHQGPDGGFGQAPNRPDRPDRAARPDRQAPQAPAPKTVK